MPAFHTGRGAAVEGNPPLGHGADTAQVTKWGDTGETRPGTLTGGL